MSLHPSEELLATGGCQERKSHFSLGCRCWQVALAPVEGPAPICMQSVPIRLSGYFKGGKKQVLKLGREVGGQDPGGTEEVVRVAYTAHMCEILNE